MAILSFLKKNEPKQETSQVVRTALGIYQMRDGDVIMTRPLFDLLLQSILELPTLEPPQAKLAAEELVLNLKQAIGERV